MAQVFKSQAVSVGVPVVLGLVLAAFLPFESDSTSHHSSVARPVRVAMAALAVPTTSTPRSPVQTKPDRRPGAALCRVQQLSAAAIGFPPTGSLLSLLLIVINRGSIACAIPSEAEVDLRLVGGGAVATSKGLPARSHTRGYWTLRARGGNRASVIATVMGWCAYPAQAIETAISFHSVGVVKLPVNPRITEPGATCADDPQAPIIYSPVPVEVTSFGLTAVPFVVGETLAEAQEAVRVAGLDARVSLERTASASEGVVVSQYPNPGAYVPLHSFVRLTTAIG